MIPQVEKSMIYDRQLRYIKIFSIYFFLITNIISIIIVETFPN